MGRRPTRINQRFFGSEPKGAWLGAEGWLARSRRVLSLDLKLALVEGIVKTASMFAKTATMDIKTASMVIKTVT